MSKKYFNSLIVIITVLFTSMYDVKSQEIIVVRDLEMRNNISLTKNFGKKIEINLAEEFRFIKNASILDILITELSAEYEIIKRLNVGLEYRFYRNALKNGGYIYQDRIRGMFSYSYKIERFKLAYRLSFQNKDESLWLSDEATMETVYNLRNKISVDYNIRKTKLAPSLSAELFRKYKKNQEASFSKIRLTAKIAFPVIKRLKVDLFYRYDGEINDVLPISTYIVGTGINYKF